MPKTTGGWIGNGSRGCEINSSFMPNKIQFVLDKKIKKYFYAITKFLKKIFLYPNGSSGGIKKSGFPRSVLKPLLVSDKFLILVLGRCRL